jgi:hypothetical protein
MPSATNLAFAGGRDACLPRTAAAVAVEDDVAPASYEELFRRITYRFAPFDLAARGIASVASGPFPGHELHHQTTLVLAGTRPRAEDANGIAVLISSGDVASFARLIPSEQRRWQQQNADAIVRVLGNSAFISAVAACQQAIGHASASVGESLFQSLSAAQLSPDMLESARRVFQRKLPPRLEPVAAALSQIREQVGISAADAAERLLDALRAFEALTPKRVVGSGEDVLFYFSAPPRRAEIVCENDGAVVVVLSGSNARPEVWSDTTPTRLPEALARVRAHLL